MIHRLHHRAVRTIPFLTPGLVTLALLFTVGIAFAATIGDQVELHATHQAGVPLHQEPRGTNDFQRIPDGTRAHVIDVAKGGQWLKLSLSDGRTGWVTSRYVRSSGAGGPITRNFPCTAETTAHRGRPGRARG